MSSTHPFSRARRAASHLRLGPLLILLGLAIGRAGAQEPLYVQRDTLAQTLLATQARLASWQAQQADARRGLQPGPWFAATVGGEPLDAVALTQQGLPTDAAGGQRRPRWTKRPADGAGNPNLANITADFLFTTITAERPVTLTLDLSRHERFGGFAYRPPPSGAGVQPSDPLVWLNGRQVPLVDRLAGYSQVPVAKRRGWHEAVLVDLPLERGANRLLVSLRKGSQAGWFNTVRLTPEPVPALWAMIENGFPRSRNRLLELVPAAWFDAASGWFTADATPRWEDEFLSQMVAELGAEGAVIQRLREALAAPNAAASPGSARREDRLMLCVTAAEWRACVRALDALEAAIRELHAAFPERYPGGPLLARAADLRQRLQQRADERLEPAEEPTQSLYRQLADLQRDALVAENPLLKGKQLLFVKRFAYDGNHYYDEFNTGISRFGGGLCCLAVDSGAVTDVAPQLAGGVFDRYDLSFDGRRIAFDYKPPQPTGFRLFEIGADGSGLRQVTFPPEDERQRIATYSQVAWDDLQRDPRRYGHWTDDIHPCYLPDGRIVFSSTRSERGVLCGGHSLTVTNLYRLNADGGGLHQLSQGALSEFCPTVMNDGRILYNRWEYVDKGAGAVQSLWAVTPDGSRSEEIYGNNITTPPVFNQARHVPGCNHLVVCLGAGHCPGNMGAILLVDLHKNKRTEEAMTALTPECLPQGNWALRQYRNGRWLVDIYGPWFCDPFPLTAADCPAVAGKFFLVYANPDGMWNEPAGYGLYLLDVFGNRVPIYRDSVISCWQPQPLEPRVTPPVLAAAAPEPDSPPATATVLVADVYQGLDGVAPGTVKYLRVMEQVPRPWSAYRGWQANDSSPGQMAAISLYTHLSVKVLHGVVPVQADGSAHFTVPADRDIFFQALDENFMEVQRMRTFVNFQPGEQRSCIGCHEHRGRVPANRRPLALASPPVAPQALPGEVAPRPLYYATDVQPIFDRHCVRCHNEKKTEGGLDLSGELTDLFNRSYENLIRQDMVCYIQEFVGPKPEAADAMGYAPAVPPYTYGSHRSRLIAALREGHYDVQLPREDFIRLVTWVDANAPYYGSYFGRRHLASRDRPDFRPLPTLEAAWGLSAAGN